MLRPGEPYDAWQAFCATMLQEGVNVAPSPYEAAFFSAAHDDAAIADTLAAAEGICRRGSYLLAEAFEIRATLGQRAFSVREPVHMMHRVHNCRKPRVLHSYSRLRLILIRHSLISRAAHSMVSKGCFMPSPIWVVLIR